MIKVICQICENATPPSIVEFTSKLIARDTADTMKGIAEEIVPHLQSRHPEVLLQIQHSIGPWSSFLFLNEFRAGNEDPESLLYETEKEKMRDLLVDAVMKYAKDDEDEDSEEDTEEDEAEEDEDMFDEEQDEDESDEEETIG